MANATTELQWMRTPVPTEISPDGIYAPHLTNLKTRALGALVEGAIKHEYVLGKYDLVLGQVRGFIRYMFDTVQNEGIIAKLDDFISFYPVVTGSLADESAELGDANDVIIRGRFLKDLKLDKAKFTFKEVGVDDARISITTYGSSFGDKRIGQVSKTMHVVGKNFVQNAASKVGYTYLSASGAKTGTFNITNWTDGYCFDITVKSDDTVWPTIPAEAPIVLDFELYPSAEEGTRKQTLTKPAVVATETSPTTTITQVTDGDGVAGQATKDKGITIDGTLFPTSADELKVATNKLRTLNADGSEHGSVGFDTLGSDGCFVSNSATQIKLNELIWTPLESVGAAKFEVTINGATKIVDLVTA